MSAVLVGGLRYTAQTTGTVRGRRVFRDITFTAARDQVPEPFIRQEGRPEQDRVFVTPSYRGSGQPMLVVTNTIRPL